MTTRSSPDAGSGDLPAPAPPVQRRLRNYLLSPRFQLKYTGILVSVALLLMGALGTVIYHTTNVAARQAASAMRQSLSATTQAERAMQESATSSRLVRMNLLSEAADNPELVRTINTELEALDREAARNVAWVRAQRTSMIAQRRAIEQNRRRTLFVLLGAGLTLVVLLGLAGIVITHRVVGPVYRMKRLLRQVGDGQLTTHEQLRKGDELGDLFETFMGMVNALRSTREGEVARLDQVIGKAERTGVEASVLADLREFRSGLSSTLAARGSVRPPA